MPESDAIHVLSIPRHWKQFSYQKHFIGNPVPGTPEGGSSPSVVGAGAATPRQGFTVIGEDCTYIRKLDFILEGRWDDAPCSFTSMNGDLRPLCKREQTV